ncbi:hypothetical protein F4805DRAFT_477952 [Annulohypoxylon moriforme]|nr:hypothetical protein F4805DRAFT_477952 [Annulohypoxylon moriforme]
MPVLTRKRKAELEAAEREVQEQLSSEADHAMERHSPKRIKVERQDPFKRIDPFRPRSPPKTVLRRRREVKYSDLKKKPKPRHPVPIAFFIVPEADPAQQVSAKSRSTNNVDTIMATTSLFKHMDKYGIEAMPTRRSLENWLEEHKDEFIQARAQRARKQSTPVRRVQAASHAAGATGSGVETPAARHPASSPRINRPVASAANDGIFRRAIRRVRRTVDRILNRAVDVLEETIPGGPAHIPHIHYRHSEYLEHIAQRVPLDRLNQPTAEPTQVRPIMPPLDPRFFHPNGQLQSVYKYLTAQIPLPQQWVKWALNNGIKTVPGRGDLRHVGTYVADDTFDYDALYQAVHRGHFKTGRIEIDYHLDHWSGVEGRRDDMVVDLELPEFRASPEPESSNGSLRGLPSTAGPEPEPELELEPEPELQPEPEPSRSTYCLPDNFSDTTDYSTTQAATSDAADEDR